MITLPIDTSRSSSVLLSAQERVVFGEPAKRPAEAGLWV